MYFSLGKGTFEKKVKEVMVMTPSLWKLMGMCFLFFHSQIF